jgi:glutamate formiminotransferase/formiminotetrahydrofolate cyclodeaminase
VEGVLLLNVDPGEATNRTVVTFVGEPEAVCEAAFRAVRTAGELIDMRRHHGAHPRIGATDVLPLIPVSGITLEECAALARQLAERIAKELRIPCYSYEAAAFKPERQNLAFCRRGEYEALHDKLTTKERQPDFMPADLSRAAKTGCSVVGARDFLIAVNFNLNTTSVPIAHAIACDVRQKGRKIDGVWHPGTLRGVKAIGWYIEEYGIAQVSMNMTNLNVTPLHKAFEEVSRRAEAHGLHVTGTEIIGLVPLHCLTEAGRYFLEKEHQDANVSEQQLVAKAIETMHLDDLRPFNPQEKVIEYVLQA